MTASTRADGARTREAIVHEAVALATVDGLEGLSIGNLAHALDMSKSGIYAHFGSKQDLQLATVDEAARIFHAEVIEPALGAPPGLDQLVAVCDAFFDHLDAADLPRRLLLRRRRPRDGHPARARQGADRHVPGRVHGADPPVRRRRRRAHELPDDEDPDALTFELSGIILAANANFVLHQDPAALDMAKRIVRRRLGVR